jgi:DNA-binding NarL/FixJ family response regulator/tetratricopeptide (TPR) repeat protein
MRMLAEPEQRRRIVGRREELVALGDALKRLGNGRTGIVALSGDPGIGKTRLLEELLQRADAAGHLVLSGRAAELERELPFGVWVDALADYAASLGPDRLERLVGEQAAELAPVVPGLTGLDAPAGGRLQDERYRTHFAVRALLEALGARRPAVLALDDLHWADDASLELIAHLLRRPPRRGVLLAIAFRPSPARPALLTALAAAARESAVLELRLGELSPAEADALLGDDIPAPARRALYAQGGGNPFFLQELARGGAAAAAADGAAADGEVPRAVALALAQEVAALTEPAQQLARAGAVSGDPVELDLAMVAAELDEPAALTALDELLAAALLVATEVPRRYRFRHPLVRSAVYGTASEGWRLRAHARLAEVLAKRGGSLAARAHHLERCARPGDAAAVAVLVQAGADAGARAPAAAAVWWSAALRLLPDTVETAGERLGLLAVLAQALAATGQLDQALETLGEALARTPTEFAPLRARLVAACAMCENLLGRHEAAHARLVGALAGIDDQTSTAAADLQVELAADALYDSDFAAMRDFSSRGLATALQHGEIGLAVVAGAVLAFAEHGLGRSGAAADALQAAGERLDSLGDEVLAGRLDAPYYLGFAEYFGERYENAIRHLRRGIALSRAVGQGQFVTPMTICLSHAYEVRGRLRAALEQADAAVEAARLSGNEQVLCWALTAEAWIAAIAGELGRTRAAGAEAVALLADLDESILSRATRVHVAAAYLEAAEPDLCLEAMADAGAPDFAHVEPGRRAWLYGVLARAELARGHRSVAAQWLARGEELADGLGLPHAEATVSFARALFELESGAPARAAEAAARAADLADSVGATMQAARARALAGRAAAAAGDAAAAVAWLERAESELGACGAVRFRDEAARELRRLGKRVSARRRRASGSTGIDSLSGREREVAELVAQGRTNKQIAAELFLSEKTVESHLAKVFTKLGVSARAAVAEAVGRARTPDS